MQIEDFPVELSPVPGAMPVWRGTVDAAQWRSLAEQVRGKGGRLVALWASEPVVRPDFEVHNALTVRSGLVWLTLFVSAVRPEFPDIADIFPAANRMQRAVFDLLGVRASGGDARQWLRHGAWPAHEFPLRKSFDASAARQSSADHYPFVMVRGDGVHEIPVGPVHAGMIEPGHFRFSIVGERVLRLEERLGYVHKGIERRFTELPLLEGHRLASRVSGDSAVAFSWAYCQALEGMGDTEIPARASWLRALCLELERIANHLGDLGALGNDAGFAFGLAQFSRLKEELLRATH